MAFFTSCLASHGWLTGEDIEISQTNLNVYFGRNKFATGSVSSDFGGRWIHFEFLIAFYFDYHFFQFLYILNIFLHFISWIQLEFLAFIPTGMFCGKYCFIPFLYYVSNSFASFIVFNHFNAFCKLWTFFSDMPITIHLKHFVKVLQSFLEWYEDQQLLLSFDYTVLFIFLFPSISYAQALHIFLQSS